MDSFYEDQIKILNDANVNFYSIDIILNEKEGRLVKIPKGMPKYKNMCLATNYNKRKNATSRELYNLMYDLHNNGNNGSYFYKGTWNMLDNLIISRPLLSNKSGYHTDYDGGKIFRQDWMLYKDEKYNESVPDRTYGGPQYYGGISDHFPIYVTLRKEE